MSILQTPTNWGRVLSGLSQGLMAAGSPQGFSAFGPGLMQGAQAYDDRLNAEQVRKLREQQMQMEQEQLDAQRTANQRAVEAQQKQQQYVQSLPPGMMSPEKQGFLQAFPDQAPQILGDSLFTQPKEFKPNIEEFYSEDGKTKFKGYLDQSGNVVHLGGNAPIYAPQQGPGPTETERLLRLAGIDPNSAEGKSIISSKLAGSGGIQITGYDDQGRPIISIGGPAGGGPSKEYEAKMANQATLLEDGLTGLEKLVNEGGVSPTRAAIGEGLSQLGPLGNVAGQAVMGSAEKQYLAKRAGALESLANTITGAAFTEQQKQNFISMLPQPTDDDETFKAKIATMKAYISQLKKNAKVSEPNAPAAPIAPSPGGADYKSKYGLD